MQSRSLLYCELIVAAITVCMCHSSDEDLLKQFLACQANAVSLQTAGSILG